MHGPPIASTQSRPRQPPRSSPAHRHGRLSRRADSRRHRTARGLRPHGPLARRATGTDGPRLFTWSWWRRPRDRSKHHRGSSSLPTGGSAISAAMWTRCSSPAVAARAPPRRTPALLAWLRALAPRVRRLGSVCTGTFSSPTPALLDGRRPRRTGRGARRWRASSGVTSSPIRSSCATATSTRRPA